MQDVHGVSEAVKGNGPWGETDQCHSQMSYPGDLTTAKFHQLWWSQSCLASSTFWLMILPNSIRIRIKDPVRNQCCKHFTKQEVLKPAQFDESDESDRSKMGIAWFKNDFLPVVGSPKGYPNSMGISRASTAPRTEAIKTTVPSISSAWIVVSVPQFCDYNSIQSKIWFAVLICGFMEC